MTGLGEKRVIIVDDDDLLRRRIIDCLRDHVVIAGEAATLGEGVALATRNLDLALVDLGLPDGHGGDLIAYLKHEHPQCRMLVLSIFEDRASVLGAIRAGADGYILKDTPDEDVRAYVTATLEGEAPISARAALHLLKELRDPAEVANTAPAENVANLSPREKDLLERLARGRSRKEAAREMGISPFTAAEYLQNVYRKLSVNSRAEAVYEALQARLISLDTKKN